MSVNSNDFDQLFADGGVLSADIPGYKFRAQQLEMSHAILGAIEGGRVAVTEAGTGTGKTVAYLVPALLAGGKVIVSTGTKNLQDQLFHRDIPAVRRALRVPVTVALLKGRANYLCHYHLEKTRTAGRLASREDVRHLRLIVEQAAATASGDRAEFHGVPENAGIWSHVTSTRENCLGADCPNYKECHVMAARKDAQQADVVVVNHHLFFADVMLRGEGMAELLPACNTVILDEAHQLPEIARMFFGETISSHQMMELARDAMNEGLAGARESADWPQLTRDFENSVRDARLVLPEMPLRIAYAQLQKREALHLALGRSLDKLLDLERALEKHAERSEGLQSVWRRATELREALQDWVEAGGRAPGEEEPPWQDQNAAVDAEPNPAVRWVESGGVGFQLHLTPMSIASIFREQVESEKRAWIFTSATLAVKSDFAHYLGELGLDKVEGVTAQTWPSPFEYEKQSLLYVPSAMPDPLSPDFTAKVVDRALPLIEAAGGGVFMLFTTLKAMRLAYDLLSDQLPRRGLEMPLLLQGDASRTELLERFRRHGNAILVASQSFWEGVDVKGEALQLVVIDKLPFAPPDDPVLAARIDAMKRQGRNAFMEYQLPHAAISLKQGAGRLIRDETDRGVLMICDTRLVDKPYGRRLWQALPPMKRTRIENEALDFFSARSHKMAATDASDDGATDDAVAE
ncbi:MAG TPA: ATP-dependent DNA helicase [Burkholderiales bacterium]